jgi:glutamate synthase domain-containing protein 2
MGCVTRSASLLEEVSPIQQILLNAWHLGADAIYIGTAALIAINCQQYRVCYTGLCPTGCCHQNPQLTNRLKVEDGMKRLS